MTSLQYDRRTIFVSSDIRFQDGDIVDLVKTGTVFFCLFFFLSMSALALGYFAISYTHILPLYLGTHIDYRYTLGHSGSFYLRGMSIYVANRFNNISLCPLIFIPYISGLRASLVYHLIVVWVVWNNLYFFVWHFAITVMSSFWRYLFVGIALMTWPKT